MSHFNIIILKLVLTLLFCCCDLELRFFVLGVFIYDLCRISMEFLFFSFYVVLCLMYNIFVIFGATQITFFILSSVFSKKIESWVLGMFGFFRFPLGLDFIAFRYTHRVLIQIWRCSLDSRIGYIDGSPNLYPIRCHF